MRLKEEVHSAVRVENSLFRQSPNHTTIKEPGRSFNVDHLSNLLSHFCFDVQTSCLTRPSASRRLHRKRQNGIHHSGRIRSLVVRGAVRHTNEDGNPTIFKATYISSSVISQLHRISNNLLGAEMSPSFLSKNRNRPSVCPDTSQTSLQAPVGFGCRLSLLHRHPSRASGA